MRPMKVPMSRAPNVLSRGGIWGNAKGFGSDAEEAMARRPPEAEDEPGPASVVARTKVGVACAMKRAATRARAAMMTVDAPILSECTGAGVAVAVAVVGAGDPP